MGLGPPQPVGLVWLELQVAALPVQERHIPTGGPRGSTCSGGTSRWPSQTRLRVWRSRSARAKEGVEELKKGEKKEEEEVEEMEGEEEEEEEEDVEVEPLGKGSKRKAGERSSSSSSDRTVPGSAEKQMRRSRVAKSGQVERLMMVVEEEPLEKGKGRRRSPWKRA